MPDSWNGPCNSHFMQLKSLAIVVFFFLQLFIVLIPARAEVLKIPDIQSRVSDQFVLESIAKLDDFIEEVRRKESVRDAQNVGFSVASVVHLGTMSGALIDQFLYKTKLLTPVFSSIGDVSDVGKAGAAPAKFSDMGRKWMVTATAVQTVKPNHEKTFVVNIKDLQTFREVLTQVRDHQALILYKLWKADPIKKASLDDMPKIILESRPSFRKIYDECSSDPGQYKVKTSIDIYRYSLFDYLKVLTLTPNFITAQYNAGIISPTLRNYMDQEVVSKALKKCFKVDPNAWGIFENESERFIAQLLAVDAVSKFVLISAVVTVWKFKNAPAQAGSSGLAKLQASRLGKLVQPAIDLFYKISPALITKVIIATQVAASSFALYTIHDEYKQAQDEASERRTVHEFRAVAKKFFHVRAVAQIEVLNSALGRPGLDEKDKESLQSEITKWETIAAEFKS